MNTGYASAVRFSWQGAISLLYQDKIEEVGPNPFIQNHVIQIDGDTASGNCAVEVRLVEDGKAVTACGYYDDVYQSVNGEWEFARRNFELYH